MVRRKVDFLSWEALVGESAGGQLADARLALQKALEEASNDSIRATLAERSGNTDTNDPEVMMAYLDIYSERTDAVREAKAHYSAVSAGADLPSVAASWCVLAVMSQLENAVANSDDEGLEEALLALNGYTFTWEHLDGKYTLSLTKPAPRKSRGNGNGGSATPWGAGERSYQEYYKTALARKVVNSVVLWEPGAEVCAMLKVPPGTQQYRFTTDDVSDCIRKFMSTFAVPLKVAKTNDVALNIDGGYYTKDRVIDSPKGDGYVLSDGTWQTMSIHHGRPESECRDYWVAAKLLYLGCKGISYQSKSRETLVHYEMVDGIALCDSRTGGAYGFARKLPSSQKIDDWHNAGAGSGRLVVNAPKWEYHPEMEEEVATLEG